MQVIGVVKQIFESSIGFDGARWPLSVSFELPKLNEAATIKLGALGVKNGRAKIMACYLVCHVLSQGLVSQASQLVEMMQPALVSLANMGCYWKRAHTWSEFNV